MDKNNPLDIFNQNETKEPFKECNRCKKDLNNEVFMVEKVFRQAENTSEIVLLFEFAVCMECAEKFSEEISDESRKNIEEFQSSKLSHPPIFLFNQNQIENEIERRLNTCAFSGAKKEDLDEYQVVGIFNGHQLMELPLMISGSAKEKYAEILSKKTKDTFDDFFNDLIDIPPSLAKILDKDVPVYF